MCKQLLSILFPLNILGKNRKSRKFTIGDGFVILNITYTGEKLDCLWTYDVKTAPPGMKPVQEYFHERVTYSNGSSTTEQLYINQGAQGYREQVVAGRTIYFSCTNITSLVVNGQTLI